MKLLETKNVLTDMLASDVLLLSRQQREAIRRALVEVEITIDNGDELNL